MAYEDEEQTWLKVEPKYSSKVLIGNWLEERRRFTTDTRVPGSSIYKTDFICFPDHKANTLLRRAMVEKYEGLPAQHFLAHHDEPRSRHLVSEYDDQYNRHGYNPALPPLRVWNGRKLAWVPQKTDFPILEPPTNYGLLEHLMKKWFEKEADVMISVYTISYGRPPSSAFATCPPRQTRNSCSTWGCFPHVSPILDYEGGQKYLQAISQLGRDSKARDTSV
ncbi:PREDICTED: uncharacterized protein C1orf158 homolog [Apaloderma vittatum]|uniref:uncharacterized protein C1orf158 homolog n=1 Tax=Apaloderma vittatum TaxID=57397 RepID=UPI000521BE07|nr:PREDICTED: uncharacterized protein C1orf158 homolog [Apaloderma vittatum]